MKYPKMDWGTMEAVVNKPGGEDGVRRFLSGELVLQVVTRILATVKTFDPVAFIGQGWKLIKKETDGWAKNIEQVDFTKVNLETCLKQSGTSITGEEKLKRLKEGGNIRLGVETFLALWQEPEHKTLEWLYGEKGVTYLDFFGDVLRSPCGCRCVLCLCRGSDGRWHHDYYWLNHNWYGTDFTASLAS